MNLSINIRLTIFLSSKLLAGSISYHTFLFITEYQEEIPFVNAAPIDQVESKKQQKQKDGQKKS